MSTPGATGYSRVLRPVPPRPVSTGAFWLNLGDGLALTTAGSATRKSHIPCARTHRSRAGELHGDGSCATRSSGAVLLLLNRIPSRPVSATTSPPSARSSTLLTKSSSLLLRSRLIREPHTSRPPEGPRRITETSWASSWLSPSSDSDSGLAGFTPLQAAGHPCSAEPRDVTGASPSSLPRRSLRHPIPALARRMILAGGPQMRCSVCRKPWTERLVHQPSDLPTTSDRPAAATPRRTDTRSLRWLQVPRPSRPAKLSRDWLNVDISPTSLPWPSQRIGQAPRPPPTTKRR